jgi:hypothetical protein
VGYGFKTVGIVYQYERKDKLTLVKLKMAVFWVVAPYSLVEV